MDITETLYLESLELDITNSWTICNYANFLCNERRNFDKAEEYYKICLKCCFKPSILYTYAKFLWQHKKQYDKAEKIYLDCIQDNPDSRNYFIYIYIIY